MITKTESKIITQAAAGGHVYLMGREKKALVRLMDQIRPLRAAHHRGNVVRVFFDQTIYMGTEPDEYLTPEMILSKY